MVRSVLLWQTLRQDTPWLEVGPVWTEIGLNTLYYAKLWKRNNVPSSSMGLMSSIRKSFSSCQMVDITLSNSCFFCFFFTIATPCLCLFTQGRSHRTCVLPHSLALVFSPASVTVCNFFFFLPLPDLAWSLHWTNARSLPWLVTGQLYFIIQTLIFSVSFVCLPSFEQLNLWSRFFFFLHKVPQLKRGNQSLSSVVFSAFFCSPSIILLIINSLYNYSYKLISSLSALGLS